MVPRNILDNLAGLRGRERLVAFVWGAARWLAIVLGLLLVACLVDYLIDRTEETPWGLRRVMFFGQIVVAIGLGFWFIVWPLLRRRSDADLALAVERKNPRLANRLISTVQLNRSGARTEGMSRELIDVVTREADKQTRDLRFADVADGRPLGWSLAVALPALGLAVLPIVLFPDIAGSLLARQFLADKDIPRRTHIEVSLTRHVFAKEEDALLTFKVKGKDLDGDDTGIVLVQPQDAKRRRITLELNHVRALGEDEALFEATVPAASVASSDFTFTARLRDSRMRTHGSIRYVPRPEVQEIDAVVLLPEFCGLRPDKTRYEQSQGQGDLSGIPGSSARVRIFTQKPVVRAKLRLLGYAEPIFKDKEEDAAAPTILPKEVVKREITLTTNPVMDEKKKAWLAVSAPFDLHDDEHAYTIEVADEHGFTNQPQKRRKVTVIPEEPPIVTLLKEQFPPEENGASLGGPLDDYEVSGMPAVLGKKVRLAYTAGGTYGLGRAVLLYRVLRKTESGNEDPGQEDWTRLPLSEQIGSQDTGPFDPRRGCFERTPLRAVVPFHAVPSHDPENFLGRKLGGGRYDLETAGLVDGKGQTIKLKKGDQIEYCVEVYADKNPASKRPFARSETRVTTVVDINEFHQWVIATLREEEQIRQLDSKQRGLFGEK